ncbi:MAG: RIP metalloprotease RseP [Candidatus Doudnabacteria bacterium]|nr:RIP metalloprotease RseP [Candidatus Doudnabacteria bacterium]
MILLTILIFAIILGLLVFVHELGHFIMAKRAGMKVDEFGFGFPPRIFGIKKGDTIYSINLIPLGGFVKIVGENGDSEEPGSFGSKPFWPRFAVLIAGVTMNVIFAWLLISIGMTSGLPTVIGEGDNVGTSAHVGIAQVSIVEVGSKSPAFDAGLKLGDSIYKINSTEITSITQAQTLIKDNAGKATTFELRRGNTEFSKSIVPRVNPPEGEGALGVSLSSIAKVSYPWYESIWKGLLTTLGLIWATLSAFWGLIVQAVHHQPVGAALSGPVGIAVLTRDVAQLGLIYLIQFTAILSINLAIINAIPFPALDGGRVLFLVIEKLRRRKLNPKAESLANAIGFSLLILLMVFVTVKDVSHYSEGFKRLFGNIF